MNPQRSFFEPLPDEVVDRMVGHILKERAIKQVRDNADQDWRNTALAAVRRIALTQPEFTTDDVWVELCETTPAHDPRAMGAVMTDAARAGICRKSDRVRPSERKECHRRPIAIWISNLHH